MYIVLVKGSITSVARIDSSPPVVYDKLLSGSEIKLRIPEVKLRMFSITNISSYEYLKLLLMLYVTNVLSYERLMLRIPEVAVIFLSYEYFKLRIPYITNTLRYEHLQLRIL